MSGATDTLRTAETLREAGVPDRQAAATARAIDDAITDAEPATRADLAVLRADVNATLAAMERRLILWAVGVAVSVGAAAVGLLLRLIP